MKISRLSLCALLALPWAMPAHSASVGKVPPQKKEHYAKHSEAHVHKSSDGLSMPYRLFIPKHYDPKKKYPLLLSLHGAGSRSADNSKHLRTWVAGWIDDSVQAKHPCFILMPQTSKAKEMGTWSGRPWNKVSYPFRETPISNPMRLAKEILDKVVAEKSIDQDRVYVMGASMGGCGTWSFTMRFPELVAAAVPVCGNSDPTMADALKDIPIWTFHGDLDRTVPFRASVEMVEAIKKAGGTSIKFTVYKGVKHGAYKLFWQERELVEWVFKQNLKGRNVTPGSARRK